MKDSAFAAAINREHLRSGADALGVEFDTHVETVIGALAPESAVLLPSS